MCEFYNLKTEIGDLASFVFLTFFRCQMAAGFVTKGEKYKHQSSESVKRTLI